MHTWTFNQNSLTIRSYKWLWGTSTSDLNFCQLFWGILLSPVALVLKTLGIVLAFVLKPFGKGAKKIAANEEFVEKVSHSADQISGFFQKHEKIFKGIWIAFLVAWFGFILVAVVIAFINHFWSALAITGIIIGIVALIVGVIALALYLDDKGSLKRFGHFFADGYHSVKDRTCPVIKIEE